MRARSFLLAGLLLALLLSLGCGGTGKTVKVQGMVTLDDQPVEGADVRFIPLSEAEGVREAFGRTDAAGKFELSTLRTNDGALPGEYRVTVTYQPADEGGARVADMSRPDQVAKAMQSQAEQQRKQGEGQSKILASKIPAIYGDRKNSPLKETVPPPGKVELKLSSTAR